MSLADGKRRFLGTGGKAKDRFVPGAGKNDKKYFERLTELEKEFHR